MTTQNPFTTAAGATPPFLAGREDDIEDFRTGLQEGVGAPERVTLVTGPAGVGKTALLDAYHRVAREEGWLVAAETAQPGVLRRLVDTVIPGLAEGSSAEEASADAPIPDFRFRVGELLDGVDDGRGVLLTIDDARRTDELETIAHAIQHLRREGREIAFVGAGLPEAVQSLLAGDGTTTFLRRADLRPLDRLAREDTRAALEMPIRASGRDIAEEALEIAVIGTEGWPAVIQRVGAEMWRASEGSDRIGTVHARAGLERARRESGS